MDLNQEIDAVVARLSAGEDPRPILTSFAKAVRGAGKVVVERDVFRCVTCHSVDAVCFQCKALSMVGERGMAAMPTLIPKLGELVTNWAAERKARKEEASAESARATHARRPPHAPGQQRF